MVRRFGMTAVLALIAAAVMLAVPTQAGAARSPAPSAGSELAPKIVAGVAHGLVRPHGAKAPAFSARRSPNMSYHGGVIMTSASIQPIFWGTTWNGYSGDKMTG